MKITITESAKNKDNILYIISELQEVFSVALCHYESQVHGNRVNLIIDVPENYQEIVQMEVLDRVSDIIAVNYKYKFFNEKMKLKGLNENDREIMLASLISADLEDDKKYIMNTLNLSEEITLDGIFNFRMGALKNKWKDIVELVPVCFLKHQLKDFLACLNEGRKKPVFVDNGRVYDSHYRRLNRSILLGAKPTKFINEIILSNGGEIRLSGKLCDEDSQYLQEYYSDNLIFIS